MIRRMPARSLWLLALLVAFASFLPSGAARADDDGGLVLDGRPAEDAWQAARRFEVETLPGATEGEPIAPDVRLLVRDGSLWIYVAVPEPPGPGMGFSVLLAAEGEERAADAVALAYAPQDPRSPLYVARGPRGVGRATYRVEAAADVTQARRWSVEARLPLPDLGLPASADAISLRAAVAVRSRRPEVVAWAPPSAAFASPDSWGRIDVTAAARAVPVVAPPDASALAAEDARDLERLESWRLYLAASRRTPDLMVQARGFEDVLDPKLTREALRDAVTRPLLEPLQQILALRPELAIVQVLRGDVLRQLGENEAALEAYAAAERVVPGLPEARFGAWVQTRGPAFGAGQAGRPTDYAAARANLAATPSPAGDPVAADGLAYGGALLDLAEGGERLAPAAAALARLVERYGFDQLLAYSVARARKTAQDWAAERQRRRRDAERDDLPRVRLRTSRGNVLVELFEDDVPNSVFQFVHLTRAGTYDGSTVGGTIPFLAALVALDQDPGYLVPTERGGTSRARGAFRGVIGFLGTARDTEAAAFFLTTGTATHLGDEFVVFGRVLEGQEVVDALRTGDAIERAEVVRTRPGVTYRPVTAKGEPAPDAD